MLIGYGTNNIITGYINRLNFYIFPVLNPDGFIYSRSSPNSTVCFFYFLKILSKKVNFKKILKNFEIRQWRKNRAPIDCTGFLPWQLTGMCCEGVDLNRNWDIGFSRHNYPFNNSCSDEFQGPHPFSEPESRYIYINFFLIIVVFRAVRDFILSKEINGKVQAYIR